MLKIARFELKSGLILAPMAGITDFPFRMLNRKFGCEMAFVEMINCRSLSYKSKRTRKMLSGNSLDMPLGVQILGCEERFILKALDVLRDYEFNVLDLNAACPAKKVVRRGEGAALLKEPQKLNKILSLIVKNAGKPVTVKIRTGWDRDSVNAREVALGAEDAGISALFIHGRTKLQEYSGTVDYMAIRDAKKAVKIPVIASGDVFSGQLARKMLDETGCDGIAVARGALGNPWIFKEIQEFLKSGLIIDRPDAEVIKATMLEHLDANIGFYGERNAVVIFRKFFAWYTRGFRKIRHLRERSSRIKTREEMAAVIQSLSGPHGSAAK